MDELLEFLKWLEAEECYTFADENTDVEDDAVWVETWRSPEEIIELYKKATNKK